MTEIEIAPRWLNFLTGFVVGTMLTNGLTLILLVKLGLIP